MIKSYASYFVSYLLSNIKKVDNISNIILFGSVAKGLGTKNSDVDIFIEVKKKLKSFEKEILGIEKKFYFSREALVFKNKGIENKINIIVGKLEDWKDLKESLESTGIVLYGNYISSDIKGKKHVLFFWNKIGKNRGAFLNKLYGFNLKDKKYLGMIEKFNGKKLGKSSFIVGVENREYFVKLMRHYDVDVQMIEVWY